MIPKPSSFTRLALLSVATVRDKFNMDGVHRRLIRRGLTLKSLAAAGRATVGQLLEADFGTAKPVGLEIVSPPLASVEFDVMKLDFGRGARAWRHSIRNLLGCQGIYYRFQGRVLINPTLVSTATLPSTAATVRLGNVVMHEAIHRLQDDARAAGWDSSYYTNNVADALALPAVRCWTDRGRLLAARFNREARDGLIGARGQIAGYLAQDVEMQARLHEVITTGYAAWNRMPVTKIELWAALHGLGLATPPQVMGVLRDTPEGRQALRHFTGNAVIGNHIKDQVSQLNEVYRYGSLSENKFALWKEAMPRLYGNLLELYGDRLGRERMGLGLNPKPHQALLAVILYDPPADRDRLGAMIDDVPAALKPDLLQKLIYRYCDDARNVATADFIVRRILQDPLIDKKAGAPCDGTPTLFTALHVNRGWAVKSLIDGGIDPCADYICTDKTGSASYTMNLAEGLDHQRREVERAAAAQGAFLPQVFARVAMPVPMAVARASHLLALRQCEPAILDRPMTVNTPHGTEQTTLAAALDRLEQSCAEASGQEKPSPYTMLGKLVAKTLRDCGLTI